ncbi:SDR family oxidoreductase [Marinobacter salinexigens]|uniref:SDR family oxidoreductase n=1 Tax=Marinobacter salinexigens TaxID=2919747 RepID=A0A5B0VIZ3_9GAMM|nr:SDR family oxidoreductase [Marinobacter salinexigens]KAA1174710.1 SDR family oxidoreductase [Marinobacter salinexigens]
MNVLLTGATGFVGKALARALRDDPKYTLTCSVRTESSEVPGVKVVTGDISGVTDWSTALHNQDVVIHSAAHAHVMDDDKSDSLDAYRRVNVEGTLRLARQSVEAGVRRFVFISSIKVNGEQTRPDCPYTEEDVPAPVDACGLSKLEAETALLELGRRSGLEVVIIRSPLVYGPGVKGNFASLIKLVDRSVPLPLGMVNNQRSLVALANLVDLIILCADHPAAANEVFLAGDGQDLSTTELLRAVGEALGRSPRLLPVPVSILNLGARLMGKKEMAYRVLGSLQVDISKARNLLGWKPPVTPQGGLEQCFEQENIE